MAMIAAAVKAAVIPAVSTWAGSPAVFRETTPNTVSSTASPTVDHVRPEVTKLDLLRLGHGLCVATERATPEEAERLLDILVSGLRPA
ncbi:hypothetical protein L3Q67_22865 [Saccharothrix sp. AJ9571]|nr:hypothetical protein L3Q67_22865 [Saccharothrix sp. AJ9571]